MIDKCTGLIALLKTEGIRSSLQLLITVERRLSELAGTRDVWISNYFR